MKKFTRFLAIIILCITFSFQALALNKQQAVEAYQDELMSLGMEEETASQKAQYDVDALLNAMKNAQSEAEYSFENIKERVNTLLKTDLRQEEAKALLGSKEIGKDPPSNSAEGLKNAFLALDPEKLIFVQKSVAGALPALMPDSEFDLAQKAFESIIGKINRILIAPPRPGTVPRGDLVSDFLPQIIRQLFRFAWIAILIAFIVSGVMLITALDDDEKITKAKRMIYYSLIGFAFIALAFALVKAVTNIDFFNFV